MDASMYDAQADNINVDDIARNSNNRIVLRRLQRNNADDAKNDYLWIQNVHDSYGEACVNYVPDRVHGMGWLGYFIGKNDHLEELFIRSFTPPSGSSVRDVIAPFFRGVSCNKSIRKIDFTDVNLLGGEVFTMLNPLFTNNHNLTKITVKNCDFGDEGCRLFALALGSSTNKSLETVELDSNNIAEEGMVGIITALSMHPHLKQLALDRNRLGKNGCVALATLLRSSAKELQYLCLARNNIGDEEIEALVPALTNFNQLMTLSLTNNPSITTRGWQSFATVLEAPNSHLAELYIYRNNIDDDAVAAFFRVLSQTTT